MKKSMEENLAKLAAAINKDDRAEAMASFTADLLDRDFQSTILSVCKTEDASPFEAGVNLSYLSGLILGSLNPPEGVDEMLKDISRAVFNLGMKLGKDERSKSKMGMVAMIHEIADKLKKENPELTAKIDDMLKSAGVPS